MTVDVPNCLPVLSVPTHTPHPPLQLCDWHWAEHTDTALHFSRQPAHVFVMVGGKKAYVKGGKKVYGKHAETLWRW